MSIQPYRIQTKPAEKGGFWHHLLENKTGKVIASAYNKSTLAPGKMYREQARLLSAYHLNEMLFGS